MTEYDNTDRGALFKNDRKEKETHPDYKGSINVGGVEYWLSSWLKTSQGGKKFMSLSVTAKDQQNTQQSNNNQRDELDDFLDENSEVPF